MYVCVKGSGVHKERQKESRAGSRVKGGADPGGARGVAVAALGFPGRGWVWGGGFNGDVKCDKDGPDRPRE